MTVRLKDTLKALILGSGWNYVTLSKEMTRITGRPYTNKKLSRIILSEKISYKDVTLIYRILGYKLKIEKVKK